MLTTREFANLLGFPKGIDAYTVTQEEILLEHELNYLWGNITDNDNPDPAEMCSESIHNPAIRYFHMILVHTLFGKEVHVTTMSCDELFIMYCASQN